MKSLLKYFLSAIVRAAIAPCARCTSAFFAACHRLSLERSLFQSYSNRGYYLFKKHFYLPIPDEEDCTDEYWNARSELPGIAIDSEKIFHFAETDLAPYFEEVRAYPFTSNECETGFYLLNASFMAVDAHLYYGLIRYLKPETIVEIGCGNSTILAADALLKNRSEGRPCGHICIEPYPQEQLIQRLPHADFRTAKVQNQPISLFESLQPGDILFIDSTHVLKAGGDVLFLYNEVLPRLRDGVYVHIHDISLPRHYPKVYYETNHYYWNEQYLLQAYLAHNHRVEIVWPGNYLRLNDERRFQKLFPEFSVMQKSFPSAEPTSFWFRTKSAHSNLTIH